MPGFTPSRSPEMLRTKAPPPPSSASRQDDPKAPVGPASYWPIHSEPPTGVENAEASAAPAEASERPGGRSKGIDEVAPVLGGPDIV